MTMTGQLAAALAATLALAACSGPAPDAPAPEETMQPTRSSSGTGTVTALDPDGGTVTIAHGPMPQIGWSAMTMTFEADPALLAGVAEGDAVDFDLTIADGRNTVTALRKP